MQAFHSDAEWRGEELCQRSDWQIELNPDAIAELERAARATADLDLGAIDTQSFELPTLASRLRTIQDSLETGSGALFLRGWPAQDHDLETNTRVFWGLSSHLGTPMSQSAKGEKIFHVRDSGLANDDKRARGPNTRKGLHFHCDRCDVIGFLCINQARTGGENYLVSSIAVHNEILRRRPDLLEELYRPWYYKTHNVDVGNDDPWCQQPIFAVQDGHFVGYVLRVLIDRAYQLDELPDMTPRQREALDFLDAVCAEPEMHYRFRQRPGDMLFVNNFVNFHSRSAFEDFDEPERKRLLLRIWLSTPNSRPLPPAFSGSFGKTGAGELRGGIHPPAT